LQAAQQSGKYMLIKLFTVYSAVVHPGSPSAACSRERASTAVFDALHT
jgi:hypothetical protein